MHYVDSIKLQARVLELLEYRDGHLYWIQYRAWNARKGQRAGTLDGKGYVQISVDRILYRGHRLIFLMHHGWLPDEIDHKDRDTTNNKIGNLRAADTHYNKGNTAMHSHNTSGYRGASLNTDSGKWHAQIKIRGKQTYLGRFDTAREAAECYDKKAKEVFGEFATLNF